MLGRSPTGRSSLVEAYLARSGMFTPGVGDPRRYDEMTGTDGSLLPGWTDLAAELDAIGGPGLSGLTGRVDRLLEDDGVTYTPVAGVAGDPDAPPAEPERWRLDPLPLVVEDAEWTRLEAGLIQRSTLLDAVLTDLYGPAKLIENGLLPPELIYQHPDYLRPAHGITIPGAHQLFFHAVDVCRSATGEFQALGDRTQAPVRRRLRDGRPPGGVPGAAGPVPPQRSSRARRLLPHHALGAGLGGAERGRGPAGRRAHPGHPFGDRVRPGHAGVAARRAAGGERRPDDPPRPAVDAVDGSFRTGRRRRPAGRRLLVRPAGPQARLPARRRRAGRGLPARHGHGREHPGQRRAGEPRAGAVPAATGPRRAGGDAENAVGADVLVR